MRCLAAPRARRASSRMTRRRAHGVTRLPVCRRYPLAAPAFLDALRLPERDRRRCLPAPSAHPIIRFAHRALRACRLRAGRPPCPRPVISAALSTPCPAHPPTRAAAAARDPSCGLRARRPVPQRPDAPPPSAPYHAPQRGSPLEKSPCGHHPARSRPDPPDRLRRARRRPAGTLRLRLTRGPVPASGRRTRRGGGGCDARARRRGGLRQRAP